MATHGALPFPSSPSEKAGTARLWKIRWRSDDHGKWDAFAPSVIFITVLSDSAWLSSPPHSWISPARDPEMKPGWAQSIPNGTLCHSSGGGWREILSLVNSCTSEPFLSMGSGPCETLVRQRRTGHGLSPGGIKESPGKEASGVFLWWLHYQSHHDAIPRDTGQAKWRHLMYKRHPPKYLPKKSLYPEISCLGSCCHTASVGAKEFRGFWGNQHLICLLLLAPLNSSLGRRHWFCRHWEPKGFLPTTWRGLSSYFLMHSRFLLPRFPHHPCRLWAHGEFSVFQQKCQVWFWHLWLSTSSKWMNARDTLLETRLVNAGGPAVRADDFLWSFTQRHGGRMLRFPSAVPCGSEFGLLKGHR